MTDDSLIAWLMLMVVIVLLCMRCNRPYLHATGTTINTADAYLKGWMAGEKVLEDEEEKK